jgi:Tfp pilus assembly protein PilF
LLLLFLASNPASADGEPDRGSHWQLSSEEREKAVLTLKKQWLKDPASVGTAIELSSHLLLLGRREEATSALLLAHAASTSPQGRSRLEARVRVVSRSFLTVEGARNYQAGVNALLAGDLKPAIARLDSVIVSEQQVLDAVVRKGQAEVMLERYDSASESFRLARRLNPFEPEVRLWLGFALLARGEQDEGQQEILAAWRTADVTERSRPHWNAWAARVQMVQGRSGAARKILGPELFGDIDRMTEKSGWGLWVLLGEDRSLQARIRKYLNLFPKGYRKLSGSRGLDLEWWDPQLLTRDQERLGGS